MRINRDLFPDPCLWIYPSFCLWISSCSCAICGEESPCSEMLYYQVPILVETFWVFPLCPHHRVWIILVVHHILKLQSMISVTYSFLVYTLLKSWFPKPTSSDPFSVAWKDHCVQCKWLRTPVKDQTVLGTFPEGQLQTTGSVSLPFVSFHFFPWNSILSCSLNSACFKFKMGT